MIENGFMSQKNSRGETSLTRVALIRAAIVYCKILVNTVSQIANWSPKAKELMKRGEEIIDTLRQGWDGEGGGEGIESLMPNASPYELVIKTMIEEQIDRDNRPRNRLSEFTFNSLYDTFSSANAPSQLDTLMENLKKFYNPILPSEEVEYDGIPRTMYSVLLQCECNPETRSSNLSGKMVARILPDALGRDLQTVPVGGGRSAGHQEPYQSSR